MEKENYIQLQALSVSYDFRSAKLKEWGIQRLKISAIGNDIFTSSTVRMERGTSYPLQGLFHWLLKSLLIGQYYEKLINKTIILSLFVALTGCNDWLDVSPKADMKAEDLFGTEAGFRDALVGVYALMCGTNSYGRDLTYGYLDVLAQYYNSPLKTTSSGYEHNFKNAAEYKYTEKTEESRISSIWSNHFSAVANINQAMLFIDENKGVFTSPEVHDVYKGEFLALRAFLHFDILRLFAPSAAMNNNKGLDALAIPYVDVFTNIAQSQLTVKEVLKK